MSGGISYCSAFPEDEIFGAITDSFLYRWTGSCISNPECEPEDMLKEILHALTPSESPDTPFLVVLILPVFAAITTCRPSSGFRRGTCGLSPHTNNPTRPCMSSPLRNDRWKSSSSLTPRVGRRLYATTDKCHDRIHQIPCPAIQAACLLPLGQTLFFPIPPSNGGWLDGRLTPSLRRPLHTRPVKPAQT